MSMYLLKQIEIKFLSCVFPHLITGRTLAQLDCLSKQTNSCNGMRIVNMILHMYVNRNRLYFNIYKYNEKIVFRF